MKKKYFILLFVNGKKKKVIHTLNNFRLINAKYNKLLKQKKPYFTCKFLKKKECVMELGLLVNGETNKPVFKKDNLGRNITVNIDGDYSFLDIKPYWVEEKIYDHQVKKRITFDFLLSNYIPRADFKQVFTLNNKLIVQNNEKYYLFSLKNVSDSKRLMDAISRKFSEKGRVDAIFVNDYSTTQRKQLYNKLEKEGFDRKFLYKHFLN